MRWLEGRLKVTAEEFVHMDSPDTEVFELVDGELVPVPSAIPLHAMIRDRAERLVWNYFDRTPIGGAISATDCLITNGTVRKPDLAIILGERWRQLDTRKVPIPFAPDIAVEVLSPSEQALDVTRKVRDYLQAGAREVWLLDPDNGEVHVRTKTGIRLLQGIELLESPLLPGFSVDVATLLAEPKR